MQSRHTRLMIFLTIILLASLSCQLLSFAGLDSSDETPEASQTTAPADSPTSEPGPTPTTGSVTTPPSDTLPTSPALGTLPALPAAQPGPETLDLASLPEVHPLTDFSERIQSVMDFTDPDGVQQQLVTLYDFRQTSVPEQAWYRLFDDNNPFLSQKNEIALVAGQGYEISSDSTTCKVVIVEIFDNSGQRQPFVDLIEALTGQASLSEAGASLGDQLVDGYPVDNSNLAPGSEIEIQMTTSDDSGTSTSTTTIQLADEGSELESGQLYLAQQGGYLARLELAYSRVATEDDSLIAQPGSTMTRTLTYEAIPATAVEPIQPPEGCDGTTGGSDDNANDNGNENDNGNDNDNGDDTGGGAYSINDIPRLEDERNVVLAGESLIFQTGQDMQSVLDFYRDALEAAGWEVTDEINLGTLASMELVRDGQSLSITLMPSGDTLMVTIVLE